MNTTTLKTIDDPEDEHLEHLCDQHVILGSFRRDPQYNSWYSNAMTHMYEEFVTKAQTLGDDDLLLMGPRKPFSLMNTVLVRTDSAAPCYNRYVKHGAGWKLEERNVSVNDIEARPLNADEYTHLADTLFGSMINTLPVQRSRTYLEWLWQSSRHNVDRTMIALRILRPDKWQKHLEIPRLYTLDVDTDWAYLAERTAEEMDIPRAALIMLPAAIAVQEERLAILNAMRDVINKDMSPDGFRKLLEPYRQVGSRTNPLMWTYWMRD